MFQYAKTLTIRKKHLQFLVAFLVAVPILLLAYPGGAPNGNTGAPASAVDSGNTCATCHGVTAHTSGMTVSGFDTGNTYTPGVTQHLTVTVPTSTSAKGFQLTVRLASNTATQEGTLKSTDGNTQVSTTSGVQFINQTSTGNASNTFQFDWTPPASNVGDIVIYVAGVSGYSNVYKASYTLTPVAPPPAVPTLSANPSSLNFTHQTGDTMPANQSFTVSSSGANVTFSASTTSAGNWLSVSPTSGLTGASGTLAVTVDPTNLLPNTYNGAVTITSSDASNTLTVPVTLTVTAPPSASLLVSDTSLTFTARNWSAPQTVTVNSSGATIDYAVAANTAVGENWLSAACISSACTTPDTVRVSVSNLTSLTPGAHYGSTTLTPGDPSIAGVTIRVKIRVPRHQ